MAGHFKDAQRAQTSLLAPIEKRVLVWMAERMPGWVNPDQLTVLGLVSLLSAGLSYWYARYEKAGLLLVILFLATNWFGDSLDGTLARVRNRLRPRYGFYVDHIVDAFGTFFLFGGLAASGYMNPWVAMGFLIAYFMISIEVYLATYTLGMFRLSHFKFSPTELRILLASGNIALYLLPSPMVLGGRYLLFDVGGVIAIAGVFVMLIRAVVQHTALLYLEETVR